MSEYEVLECHMESPLFRFNTNTLFIALPGKNTASCQERYIKEMTDWEWIFWPKKKVH